jgi:glucose-1-phosphate thymidylyltransferase
MGCLIFEDPATDALAPLTTGRLGCDITCGGYSLWQLLQQLNVPVRVLARPFLQAAARQWHPHGVWERVTVDGDGGSSSGDSLPRLIVSARLVPSVDNLLRLGQLLSQPPSSPCWLVDRQQLVGVLDPPWPLSEVLAGGYGPLSDRWQAAQQRLGELGNSMLELSALAWPHEVVAQHMRCLSSGVEHRIRSGDYRQLADGVFVAGDVQLDPSVKLDTQPGPILLEHGVSVGAFSLLRGPMVVGRSARILEHAAIKDGVCLGPVTKIGGEVEASVVEAFTNKQHHGFLGHSYLGSWINLGAGTCNSDLKNTYGPINLDYPHGKVATGMQFMGCLMGDYSKTAINTGIFTGKIVGVCAMMYGYVTSNVPSFVSYARLFGQLATLPIDVMVATQARMFARRGQTQTEVDRQLIRDMYHRTQAERDRLGESLAL